MVYEMKRFPVLALPLLSLVLLFSSCSRSAPANAPVPPLPFSEPNILGIERISTRSIETIEDALVCLASSQPVYGIAVENSNVRPAPEAGECQR